MNKCKCYAAQQGHNRCQSTFPLLLEEVGQEDAAWTEIKHNKH